MQIHNMILDKFKTNPFVIKWKAKLDKIKREKQIDIEDDTDECNHECTSNCRRNGCNCKCGEFHITCQICQDTGEVDCMDSVYPGEPHMAMVGTRKCECRLSDNDDE